METVLYNIGISASFGFLLAVCYRCLNAQFKAVFSRKVGFLCWGAVTFGYFIANLTGITDLVKIRAVYLLLSIILFVHFLFKGEKRTKIKAVLVILFYCGLLDTLTFLSYAVISIGWIKETALLEKYFFYAITEILVIFGFYKLMLNGLSFQKSIKKVRFYQNFFMMSMVILEIAIVNYLIIYGSTENQVRPSIVAISILAFLAIIAFDGGLIVFLNKMEKNFLLKQNLELQKQQMEMQETYYDKVQLQYQETAELIGNMKGYILTLKQYYEKGENEKAKDYAQKTLEEIADTGMRYGCKDKTLAIILEDKGRFCVDKGITLTVKDKSEGLDFMNPFDITTIFTNLLDNAVTAVEALVNPEVKLELINQEQMLMVLIENPIDKKPIKKNGHYLSTKIENGHGFGIKNINATVKKYDGSLEIQTSDALFTVRILMPRVKK